MKIINFKFKGNRKYVHSTDIYNHFIKKKFKSIKILIKKKINNQPLAMYINEIKNNHKILGIIEFTINKKKKKIYLVNTKKKIINKYDFEEKKLYKYFKLYKNSAKCNFKSSLSSIDVLITLTKYFHNNKIKLSSWSVVKLKFIKALDEKKLKNFVIKIKKVTFDKLTVISIFQNKKKIGEIENISV